MIDDRVVNSKNENNFDVDSELDSMFQNGDSKNNQNTDYNTEQKSGNKVLVKTNDNSSSSNENGFSSVVGVVLVIISISLIMAALFIRMMS